MTPQPSTRAGDASECGVVMIGRNEGERLRRCLDSCAGAGLRVYVDSNSTDGSRELARSKGVETVELDLRRGFTAARARNAGFAHLLERRPDIEFVMFVDGDCEIVSDWIPAALAALRERPDVVAVCGRRRERFPDASIFNRLCDIEWNTPPGDAKAFGGDVVLRAAALRAAGGYRDDLIAGEEPELCVRLREAGGRILRLDRDMTWHDAAMTRFGQWWKRNVRSGHAFAEGASLHGAPPERHFVAETRRAVLWGAVLPVAILLAGLAQPWLLLLLLVYPLQWVRIGRRMAHGGLPVPWSYAAFLLLGRFPEAQGVFKLWLSQLVGRRSALIEYK